MNLTKEDKEEFERNCEKYIRSLQEMKIGDEKGYAIHRIKRIDEYTWEYICPCCKGRRIAIGGRQV